MSQNKFAWTKQADCHSPQKIEITLSDAIHDLIIETLKQQWLLPILQGEKKELPGGMTYYCFYLPNEDAELLKQAFMKSYTKITGYNSSN